MVVYRRPPNAPRTRKSIKRRKPINDIVYQNWHLECHKKDSRLYKLTKVLAAEAEFNDLDVIAYTTNDGSLISHDIGD